MPTLRNKKKSATVSRETPENTRHHQLQNTLSPGMAEEYITQVSEEIERGSLKNFPKNLAVRNHAFWVLYLNSMNFF